MQVVKPQLSRAQRSLLCHTCGKPVEAPAAEASSSRRDALLAGAAFVAATTAAASNAPAEAAAADVIEIPVDQQCLECTGGGVVNCALLLSASESVTSLRGNVLNCSVHASQACAL